MDGNWKTFKILAWKTNIGWKTFEIKYFKKKKKRLIEHVERKRLATAKYHFSFIQGLFIHIANKVTLRIYTILEKEVITIISSKISKSRHRCSQN